MSHPFIFVSTFRLKQGKLEAFKEMCQGLVEFVESNEPRVIAFNLYASEDGTEVSNVQVHPDADSMVSHMRLLREHIWAPATRRAPSRSARATRSTETRVTPCWRCSRRSTRACR